MIFALVYDPGVTVVFDRLNVPVFVIGVVGLPLIKISTFGVS